MTGWLAVAPAMTNAQAREPATETPQSMHQQVPQSAPEQGKAPPPVLAPPAEGTDEHLRVDEPVSFPVDI
jgi:hypothetical protein